MGHGGEMSGTRRVAWTIGARSGVADDGATGDIGVEAVSACVGKGVDAGRAAGERRRGVASPARARFQLRRWGGHRSTDRFKSSCSIN